MVKFETNAGDIVIELYADQAPKTVDNFLGYVDDSFYKGTIFHRVIDGFMIQGGGMTPDMRQKPTKSPIQNESDNQLQNLRGTVAMARTSDPDSATSQFFINLEDNSHLDYRQGQPGYTVFGKVVEGMDTVDKIASLKTAVKGMHDDVPIETVMIVNAEVVNGE